eukprot:TRINITY_DN10958_c0_g1_i1.p1 TRINITY_DN10958_c0_g1~~TRINITY_DN10958_c0_g1_i1.p1  ORF type:complete len:379 (-),score=57.33 TRINITY_DN10958_c0_g1_i1:85-1221(-)
MLSSAAWKLGASAAAVIIPHCSAAFIEESLYKSEGFRFGWFQVMFLFFSCCLFAVLDSKLFEDVEGIVGPMLPLREPSMLNLNDFKGESKDSDKKYMDGKDGAPTARVIRTMRTWLTPGDYAKTVIPRYLMLSILTLLTSGLTKASLNLVNYPTQVIFKSCKLVPVMILARMFAIGGRSMNVQKEEYVAAGLLSTGMFLFSLGDYFTATAPSSSVQGICYLIIALIAEGFLGNYQQALIQERKSETELMMYNNMFAGILAFFACLFMGELVEAVAFCSNNPVIIFNLFIYSLLLYVGIKALLSIVQHYGVIAAVMIANFRKLCTMSLSFFMFPKAVSINHFIGGALVLTGVLLSSHVKVKQQQQKAALEYRKTTLYNI